jgi:hypothetical protein
LDKCGAAASVRKPQIGQEYLPIFWRPNPPLVVAVAVSLMRVAGAKCWRNVTIARYAGGLKK